MSSPSYRQSVDRYSSPTSATSQHGQFPFPSPDWTAGRQGSTSSLRRGSVASSIGSIGGSLDTIGQPKGNAMTEIGQNAISTLLQPPMLRTGLNPHITPSTSHRPPTTRDIPPVTLANIPRVDNSVFKTYLAQIAPLVESFQRARLGSEKDPGRKHKGSSQEERVVDTLERKLSRDSLGAELPRRASSTSVLSPVEPSEGRRRSGAGSSRRAAATVAPLSTIPSVYFDGNFQLENPRTFDVVSERSEVVRSPYPSKDDGQGANGHPNGAPAPPRKALATNAILQEKLSWYMDTVEIHLISSISTASASFFAALGSLKDLQSEASDSVTKIKKLREDLAKLDQDMAQGGLEILSLQRRRENLRKLGQSMIQLRCIMDGATHCEELVDSGELELAIDRLDILERYVAGKLPSVQGEDLSWLTSNPAQHIYDLRSLKALEGFTNGVNLLRDRVGKGFEARFLETLLADLRQHVFTVPNKETLRGWAFASQRSRGGHGRSQSGFPAYMKTDDKFREDLQSILHGLNRSRHTGPAAIAFREAVMREMKSLIRQHLPSSSDDDAESLASASTRNSRALSQQEKSVILARNLRALDPESAEDLLVKTYTAVGEVLRRLGVQVKVLLDVTTGMFVPPPKSDVSSPPRSPSIPSIEKTIVPGRHRADSSSVQEEISQSLDMSSLLGQAVDVALTHVTKVLKARSEQTVRLPMEFFLRYFTLNRLFTDECEAVSGRSGASLKSVVNMQIKEFVTLFGESERQKLQQVLDADRWDAKDVGEAESAALSRILESMTSDPPTWTKIADLWADPESKEDDEQGAEGETNGVKETEKARSAVIDEDKYILVASTIHLLRTVERFCIILTIIPPMSNEISTSLLDYLKLFNSRSCQLILGAGAIGTAGLKNILTKHLALASQSLSFVIALVPYLREFIRRRPSTSPGTLAEFDKVKRLVQDHQSSIDEKFVDIMALRCSSHISAMKKLDFDAEKETQRNVSPYMETLTKETSTLQRVLARHLPDGNVKMIMLPVFTNYKEQWGKAFADATVTTAPGKARLLRDAELFDTRLSKIDGSGDIGAYVKDIVHKKKVQEKPAPAPTAEGDDDAETPKDVAPEPEEKQSDS
ncbi:Vps54-domain-containing protein [Eremomyces bilateralis CBS 781.70]|uniref:Vacuolar protein sorting-associated protein 54 n=1 Tax=Eremomyces bilateralis CBS 781.70 TaxID=1392243 RepID=A0A6G1G7T3_9PEZI|nr:Vps54-domain-containing protein [Eremomyces bilateralis CBS 781.70]KAF1813909.1 Vps54-domain-containing protein [Eremomyces bilateralis CBS 781.70]